METAQRAELRIAMQFVTASQTRRFRLFLVSMDFSLSYGFQLTGYR
jgi:hypothetical protein